LSGFFTPYARFSPCSLLELPLLDLGSVEVFLKICVSLLRALAGRPFFPFVALHRGPFPVRLRCAWVRFRLVPGAFFFAASTSGIEIGLLRSLNTLRRSKLRNGAPRCPREALPFFCRLLFPRNTEGVFSFLCSSVRRWSNLVEVGSLHSPAHPLAGLPLSRAASASIFFPADSFRFFPAAGAGRFFFFSCPNTTCVFLRWSFVPGDCLSFLESFFPQPPPPPGGFFSS